MGMASINDFLYATYIPNNLWRTSHTRKHDTKLEIV